MENQWWGSKKSSYTRRKPEGPRTCGLTICIVKFHNSDNQGKLILRQKFTHAHANRRNKEQTVKEDRPDKHFWSKQMTSLNVSGDKMNGRTVNKRVARMSDMWRNVGACTRITKRSANKWFENWQERWTRKSQANKFLHYNHTFQQRNVQNCNTLCQDTHAPRQHHSYMCTSLQWCAN